MRRFLAALAFLVLATTMLATAQANPEFAGYWKTDVEDFSVYRINRRKVVPTIMLRSRADPY